VGLGSQLLLLGAVLLTTWLSQVVVVAVAKLVAVVVQVDFVLL
jgi:hypothetical protein